MRLSLPRKLLLSVGVVAGLGALAGAGIFATFTAQTTNPSNTFAMSWDSTTTPYDAAGNAASGNTFTETDNGFEF